MISNNNTVDLLQNISMQDSGFLGNSICVLAKLALEKLPIPTGFVISTLGFNLYLDLTDLRKYYEKSRNEDDRFDLTQVLEAITLPDKLRVEINSAYSKISGFTDAYVNIRALILDSNGEEISHRSYCSYDLKGESEITKSIESLYREVLTDNIKTIDLFFSGELKISLIIQKAIQSEASGTMFTTDIITKDKSKLVIEAVYGLESGTVKEGILPDQYIFNKENDEVTEKHISGQEFMIVRQMGTSSATQKVVISQAWQKRQKLDDKHILVLAKTGQIIEDELQEPQQINWSYESGKIWINFIESINKKKFQISNNESDLQNKVDNLIKPSIADGTDLNVHIPQEIIEDKEIFVDLQIENKEESNFENNNKTKTTSENIQMPETQKTLSKEPLLEGMHSAGKEAQGEITFDPENSNINHILVLRGDEDISSTLKISGFIIEDESELLAERLFEYFKVPVITGVALARKILKQGEKVIIDGKNAHVYELVPYTQKPNEIELSFVSKKDENIEKSNYSFPIKQNGNIEIKAEFSPNQFRQIESTPISEMQDDIQDNIEINKPNRIEIETKFQPEPETSKFNQRFSVLEQNPISENKDSLYEDQKVRIEKRNNQFQKEEIVEKKDLSRLLNLVEEDGQEFVKIEEPELSTKSVEGVSKDDQLKVWGNSLEKVISASKKISPSIAVGALEHVIEDTNEIEQNSREFAFDTDERYIAKIKHDESQKISRTYSEFTPTATKVYIQLIDEVLDSNLENFDGIVFASTSDLDIIFEQLEDLLEKAQNKEVLIMCPPYEDNALIRFFDGIYELRNKGFRNLSVILPDYRNKKEISEVKKLISVAGLRRSSTFEILANISRTINVFRISELEEGTTDGAYIDLFRLKMNMLGVDRLSASTKYVEGMKNLVNYVHYNLKTGKTLINISAFDSPKKVLEHLFDFGFWGVVCEQESADDIKKYISKIEQSSILEIKSSSKNNLLRKSIR